MIFSDTFNRRFQGSAHDFSVQLRGGTFAILALVLGQEAAANSTDADFFADIPMAVSATRIPQPAEESPVWTTVIDRQMIKATGAVDLADVLRLVPGMQVSKASGNWPVATYHGMTDFQPRRMQILVDGRSVYLPTLSNTDWPFLGVDMADIERIEVVQGSDAAVHGSNAFTATINIITRQPFEQRGAFISVTDGSANTTNTTLRLGTTIDDWDVRATGSWRANEGFADIPDTQSLRSVTWRAVSDASTRDAWSWQGGYSSGKQDVWAKGNAFDPMRKRDITSAFFQGNWRRMLADNSELSVQYYHNYYRTDDIFRTAPLAGVLGISPTLFPNFFGGHPDQPITLAVFDGIGNRDDIEVQHLYLPSQRLKVAWGGGVRLDQFKSKGLLGQTAAVRNGHARTFGQIFWRANSVLVANFGGFLEHNTTTDTTYSWRSSLNYNVAAQQSLRVSVAHSERAMSLLESRANWGSRFDDGSLIDLLWRSPDGLTEEKLTAYELGFHSISDNNRLVFDGKLFVERFRDLEIGVIDASYPDGYIANLGALDPRLNPEPGASLPFNSGHVAIKGGELSLKWRLAPSDFLAIQYSRATATGEFVSRIHADGSQQIESLAPTVPKHTASILASYSLSQSVQASAAYYRISRMEWMGDGDEVPGYSRVDARLGTSFRLGSAKAELAGMIHNLFQPYAEFTKTTLFERRVFVQLTIQD